MGFKVGFWPYLVKGRGAKLIARKADEREELIKATLHGFSSLGDGDGVRVRYLAFWKMDAP